LRALEQLGHVGGATALPALHDLLADGDEEVRAAARAAARAIGRRLHEHQEDRRRGAEARRRPFRRAGRPALAGHARQPGIA
jgi:HEAT repeat protein